MLGCDDLFVPPGIDGLWACIKEKYAKIGLYWWVKQSVLFFKWCQLFEIVVFLKQWKLMELHFIYIYLLYVSLYIAQSLFKTNTYSFFVKKCICSSSHVGPTCNILKINLLISAHRDRLDTPNIINDNVISAKSISVNNWFSRISGRENKYLLSKFVLVYSPWFKYSSIYCILYNVIKLMASIYPMISITQYWSNVLEILSTQ